MIGETLGNYRIVNKIGKGGMGAVYLAEHTLMARRAAIKVLLPAFSHQPGVVRRFFNEARASARLQHPALVSIYDCGHHPATGSAYLVMDYLEGESLSRRLRRVGKLPVALAVAHARAIAAGMAVAHRAGIIHRDLKPGNVFLVPDQGHDQGRDEDRGGESVRILDFGVAKLSALEGPAAVMTAAGMVLGTPCYMAPEQGRGSTAIDGRADVYALGCILFSMLCGRPPFPYRAPGQLLAAHAKELPPFPSRLEPSIPPALEREILRALAKEPRHRHADMTAMAAALAAAVSAPTRSTRLLPVATTAAVEVRAEEPPTREMLRPVEAPTLPGTRLPPKRQPPPETVSVPGPGPARPETPAPGPSPAGPRPRDVETTLGAAAAALSRRAGPRPVGRGARAGLAMALFALGGAALWRGLAAPDAWGTWGQEADEASLSSRSSRSTSGPEWTPLPPRPAPVIRGKAPPRDAATAVALPNPARPAPFHPTAGSLDDRAAPPRRRPPQKKRRRPHAGHPQPRTSELLIAPGLSGGARATVLE